MRKKKEKPYWSETLLIGTHNVYAWERLDRSGHVFIKFENLSSRGSDRRVKLKLPGNLIVRDAKGRLDAKRVREVLRKVQDFAGELFFQAGGIVRPTERPLSLADGFSAALDLERGKYATKTRRWDEVERAYRRLSSLLGKNIQFATISPADVRSIWRRLAKAFLAHDDNSIPCGVRQTEVTIDALYSVAAWLRENGFLPPTAVQPIAKWRAKLKSDWVEINGGSIEPSRPRHTIEEMRRLFAHLDDPRVDPRFALAFDLGGEQRLGQVLRCRRSQLELTPVDCARLATLQPGELGVLRILGSGHKRTSPIALNAEQRASVERGLHGYLADFEALYIAGEIADYPLFPSGRLKLGRARAGSNRASLTRDAALTMFHELENIAGVESVKSRGWYGVRRIATDVAEDVEKDARVLNAITGHRDSYTRQMVYQDRERPEILAQAARTRATIRREPANEPAAVISGHVA